MKYYKKPYKTEYGFNNTEIYSLYDFMRDERKQEKFYGTVLVEYMNFFKKAFKKAKYIKNYYLRNIPFHRKTIMVGNKVCEIFFDKMINDMIYNDTEFIFPNDTCRLSIGIKTWTDPNCTSKFKYNKRTGGITPTSRIVFDDHLYKEEIKTIRYYLRLNKRYQDMIMKEVIENNHEYSNTGRYDNYNQ